MILLQRLFNICCITTVCLFLVAPIKANATTTTPFKLLTNVKNIIVWQRFDTWLMVTEDLPAGRTCYYYDDNAHTRLNLKDPLPGNWIPLGSAIKWLMYVDYYNSLNRLMSHDVDWHVYHVAWSSSQNQVGCGMTDTKCIYGEYRPTMVGDHYPVDLYHLNVQTGACTPFCVSNSEKSQFAHDGKLIVYRAYFDPGNTRIYGHYFNGGDEFEIAARDGIEPSVCGSLVAWAEAYGAGYNIIAKDISTGELRIIAYTTANPPCPEAGKGTICWRDSRNSATTGIDIYAYDWLTRQEYVISNAAGEQLRLRVCDDLVTWVTGSTNYQTLWGANIQLPVKIKEFRISSVTSNSVKLTWASVGTTGNPPVAYDLRMRTDAPVTDSNWSTSTPVTGLPIPKSPGLLENFTIQSLINRHYYFAIKVRLQNGDYSILSDSVCAYVSDEDKAFSANEDSYISFSGIVSGIGKDNVFYCQRNDGVRALRVVPFSGTTGASNGQVITVTGKLSQDIELYGPVLKDASISQTAGAGIVKCYGMANCFVGGNDTRFGGTSGRGASNIWMLIKSWGRVSDLVVSNGCTFYINDGSASADNGGRGIYVVCPYTPPPGLVNGVNVSVEGISRFSRQSGRQIEVVKDSSIHIF